MSYDFTINYPRPERHKALDDLLTSYLSFGGGPARKPAAPPRRGDKVDVTIKATGYVETVDGDTITLVDQRAPFKGEAKRVGTARLNDKDTTVRVVERAPQPVAVGDTISGATLKATPWKRGTVVSHSPVYGSRWILGDDGKWTNANNGSRRSFGTFVDYQSYAVEHAPGK